MTDSILLDNQGIGYQIFTSHLAIQTMGTLHQPVKVFTYLHVREDELSLFGFPTTEELDAFKLLISVNGIGPKAALSILSVLTVRDLALAVLAGDTKSITRANGVGAKGAGRVIMELKDKWKTEDFLPSETAVEDGAVDSVSTGGSIQDTVLALVSLGYSELEALRAIRQIHEAETMESGELLKAALKRIM